MKVRVHWEVSDVVSIDYSTTTRAVWFILLEHEGLRPEGESNIKPYCPQGCGITYL